MTFSNEMVSRDDLPIYEILELAPLPRESMYVSMISVVIFYGILLPVTSIPGYLLNIPLFTQYLLLWIVGIILLLSLNLIWVWRSHHYKGYALREHDVSYQAGIFWRKRTILPFSRIQHVETQQGVLQRKYELATLQLFTAGGQRADLTISGLEYSVTEGIKSRILKRIQDEQGENE